MERTKFGVLEMTEPNNQQDNVILSREKLRQVIDAMTDHGPDWIESERVALVALRAALEQPAVEPVSYQYQNSDGKWCHFMNEKHYENTKADGRWPIRALYTAPQAQPAQRPVMIYHGRCVIDCGEHGHHDVEMLRMIPAGTELYTAPRAQHPDGGA